MALGISDFKSNFHGGARNNLFRVQMEIPNLEGTSGNDKNSLTYLVKATSFPASTVTPLEIPFRGRIFKIAGQRTFEEWTVTVINDTDFAIRTALEQWSASMSYHDVNTSDFSGKGSGIGSGSGKGFAGYCVDANVIQLKHGSQEHSDDYTYTFKDLWPSTIGAIDLAMEGEAIQEYQVTFQYQYWFSGQQAGGAKIGSVKK